MSLPLGVSSAVYCRNFAPRAGAAWKIASPTMRPGMGVRTKVSCVWRRCVGWRLLRVWPRFGCMRWRLRGAGVTISEDIAGGVEEGENKQMQRLERGLEG